MQQNDRQLFVNVIITKFTKTTDDHFFNTPDAFNWYEKHVGEKFLTVKTSISGETWYRVVQPVGYVDGFQHYSLDMLFIHSDDCEAIDEYRHTQIESLLK